MKMHTWVLALQLLTLVGCASHSPSQIFDESNSYPSDWSKPIEREHQADDCVSIDGTFYSHGHSDSTISERFSNPIFERSFFDLRDIADESNRFKVTHIAERQRLYFDVISSEKKLLVSEVYKQYSRCEAGWFVIESQSNGGSGDSPVKSTIGVTRIGLAKDGSFIVNTHDEAVWRKYLFGSETRVSDIWYKFERSE